MKLRQKKLYLKSKRKSIYHKLTAKYYKIFIQTLTNFRFHRFLGFFVY